ncbi:hypothetical protein [Arthrobacter sp. HLT1-20]
MAPTTAKSVAKDAGGSCPEGLGEAALADVDARANPHPTSQVFGRSALVALGSEHVFLTKSGTRWLVAAAGCKPVANSPYDCDIGGDQE